MFIIPSIYFNSQTLFLKSIQYSINTNVVITHDIVKSRVISEVLISYQCNSVTSIDIFLLQTNAKFRVRDGVLNVS